MFGLFKRKDPAIMELLVKIEECKAAAPADAQTVGAPLFDALSKMVSAKWQKEHLENYKAEIERGGKPEAFIFNYIVQVCGDRLESGRYHVYRGVLNFEGKLYQQLFEHAVNTMITTGEYSKQWADENLLSPVYKGIREVG